MQEIQTKIMINFNKFYKKYLSLDTPLALPMKFCSKPGDLTWEEWSENTKSKHPIKWFIVRTLPKTWRRVKLTINGIFYWLKCHILPSHKWHFLDLRNPGPGINYTYGFLDRPEVILYSCFVALRHYVEKEQPEDPRTFPTSPEEFIYLKPQIDSYVEAMDLYNWWMVRRIKEEKTAEKLFKKAEQTNLIKDRKRYLKYKDLQDKKEQVQLERLIKIRNGLWT